MIPILTIMSRKTIREIQIYLIKKALLSKAFLIRKPLRRVVSIIVDSYILK